MLLFKTTPPPTTNGDCITVHYSPLAVPTHHTDTTTDQLESVSGGSDVTGPPQMTSHVRS